ncbi:MULTISPECIES: XRE family transcriptional regulator [unclassified Solwaraspora]|uniref:XRE family transcriptional regulator n=1 Tax=unclassified Solwaraspora TaxID=2627926 RepID=UPI00259AF717|nr:XRE family transcriptional regulator [Solwaraspora sp. WMMA2056]WJK42782.1 XRE family transcriptional regulator [Solwaraspora sp. WMMA2056]
MNALKAARESRGWSQARLVHEIARRRAAAGAATATRASLKVYVSEWENGRRSVSDEYRAVLRAIFGLTDAELFGPTATPGETLDNAYSELAKRIEASKSVDVGLVGVLTQQTELFRSIDRQMGAPTLGDQMRTHVETLENALAYSVLPAARRPVARALAGAATLAGWQALDVGAVDRAWRCYELARRAAVEAASPALVAHAMGEQAYVLVDAGKPELARALILEALAVAERKAPARLLAWLHAAHAEFAAMLSDAPATHAALDRAAATLPSGAEMRDEEVAGIFLNEAHLTRWRGNAHALLGEGAAVEDLHAALAAMDGTFTRAEAGLRIGLAHAHLASGDLREAEQEARRARALASRTGSLRNQRRLNQLMTRITAVV